MRRRMQGMRMSTQYEETLTDAINVLQRAIDIHKSTQEPNEKTYHAMEALYYFSEAITSRWDYK